MQTGSELKVNLQVWNINFQLRSNMSSLKTKH